MGKKERKKKERKTEQWERKKEIKKRERLNSEKERKK